MPYTDPLPAPPGPSATMYAKPSNADLAAVAATVSVVGVLMALLITWLALRLRRASANASTIPITSARPTSNASYIFRPSLAPSEASSKFGFARKPLRLSHRHRDGSWDFADPDPLCRQKECPLEPPVRTPSQKHRPSPLSPTPAYTPRVHRASTHKGDSSPCTPTSPYGLEPPPPAYHREGVPWSSPLP